MHTINSAYDLAFELEVLRELLSSRRRRFSNYSDLPAVELSLAWQREKLIGTTTPALVTLECLQQVREDFFKGDVQAWMRCVRCCSAWTRTTPVGRGTVGRMDGQCEQLTAYECQNLQQGWYICWAAQAIESVVAYTACMCQSCPASRHQQCALRPCKIFCNIF
ncbi:hypothetical protein HaLaN_18480, partial [Haematococcus lacustris]